ncbi:hypothetical protein [Paenibacillus periandrae]|uniref:hypothetical protein n=1 Tax=Paenibacillus periandrae TaxID=1761741 RepID=UPI001F093760|nr:hypothetical protein [Paenibacillus periandrae]
MKYLKVCNSLDTWYFEIDDEGTAYRQVLNKLGLNISSNRKHKGYDFFLSDQKIEYTNPPYLLISKNEFDKIWNESLQALIIEWNRIKRELRIGTEIEGYLEIFYPQGLIINLFKHDAIGIVNYGVIENITPSQWLYPKHLIKGTVLGYDEINYWIELGNIEVFEKQID